MPSGAAPLAQAGGVFYRTTARLGRAISSVLWSSPRARGEVLRPAIDPLEPRVLLASTLEISEFMAANSSTLQDKDHEYPDWIEIHNAGPAPVDLAGYHLTNKSDNLNKWHFPSVPLAADGYVVVFASEKDISIAGQELHTSFNLQASGGYLALVEPDGKTIAFQYKADYPNQEPDISYGIDPDASGGTPRYFAAPTARSRNQRAEVVINEIHYNPEIKTQLVEFIELHNPGIAAVDLSGAQFTGGVEYTFADGMTLPAGGYLVVAQDPAQFQTKFSKSALGPWVGILSNEGETITLRNRSGGQLDEVDYGLGFPWPTVGDAPGYAIELINPDLDNSKGGNWRSFAPSGPGSNTTLFASGSSWRFRKGTSEASTPDKTAWRELNFVEDATWYSGTGPIGYDTNTAFPGSPELQDMKPNYTSVYMRKTFTVSDPSQFSSWYMEAMYDDGFNAWVNGTRIAYDKVADENLDHDALCSDGYRESNNYDRFNIGVDPASVLKPGLNIITVQFFNVDLGSSSDAFFDARLIATTGGGGNSPTPGRRNSVYAVNAAPAMRQVTHSPNQPLADEPVTITAKITDPEGVGSVSLSYQRVDPGSYFSKEDAAYSDPANWTTVAMNDAGTGGDATAGDDIYTVVLPGNLQVHRRLIRYRITSVDTLGASVTGPYADDPQPNFAYYCYNGIPIWSGAIQPGSTDPVRKLVVGYDCAQMPAVPVYQLITTRKAHEDSQAIPNSTAGQYGGDAYPWVGTLVYNGVIYDHIHYRARGGVWRYAMGKNMWKFDFNRGHEFQPYDEYGRPLGTTWKKLNLGANIQQGGFGQRGEQGLFEYVGFKLFNLAGAPSSVTFPIHFRIVENASETNNSPSQYDDDFQGLYLAIEQMDGRFLDEHELPDGNLYKMESGTGGGASNNQGPTQPSDNSDLVQFTNTIRNTNPTEQWWRDNVDVDAYLGYRAMVEAVHHWDIGYGKNYFFYHNPVTNKWSQHVWDLDLTWTTTYEPGGGDAEPFKKMLSLPGIQLQYKNRLREIRDLLFNQDQVAGMLDEYAGIVDWPSPGASMVGADRAMWDYNPILNSSYVNPDKAAWGRFYQTATPKTFRGFVQKLKTYVNTRGTYLDGIAVDSLIPKKPTVTYVGASGFPINSLRFESSAFSDTSGVFAAMKWRIAEITPSSAAAYDPSSPRKYEINANWESAEITTFGGVTIPPGSLQVGKTYRVRVRMKDSTGRWSNWSDPVPFVAAASSAASVKDALRITEVQYHPDAPPPDSTYTRDDFEFIELKNTGAQTINLLNVAFTAGVTFQFPEMNLDPGKTVVVVKNLAAFQTRYRTGGMRIAGEYIGGLKDSGELISLVDAGGQPIESFTYDDGWYPTTDGDGYSLVAVDPRASDAVLNTMEGWRPSRIPNGTPGATETTLADNTIVINEALTHTDGVMGDWVELYNTSDELLSISGWWLSDDANEPMKYQIQPGMSVRAHDYVVFTQSAHFDHPGGAGVVVPFAFSELGGEDIVLSSATADGLLTGYRATEEVDASDREVTLGRYVTSTGEVDFSPTVGATMGYANNPPLVGPVVINEMMYFPATGGDEWIELHNITNNHVRLYDPLHPLNTWRFEHGITYSFAAGTVLWPGEYVLLVAIDPDAFRLTYGIPAEIRIFGSYTGTLNDVDENIAIAKPGAPELDGTVPYYEVDRVHYYDVAPWPVGAAGTGASLARLVSKDYGNDPVNWAAISNGGNPGLPNFDVIAPTAAITAVDPDPRTTSVDSITIVFSEAVTGFDLADLTLVRNGSGNLLTAVQTLVTSDSITYVLGNLADLTWPEGAYALSLIAAGSQIEDAHGNDLAEAASEGFVVSVTTLPARSAEDDLDLRVSGSWLEIRRNAGPGEAPTYVLPLSEVTELRLARGSCSVGGDLRGLRMVASGSEAARPTAVTFDVSQHLAGLSLAGSVRAALSLAGGGVLRTGGLSIIGEGILDIAENDLIIQSTAADRGAELARVFNWIKSARSGDAGIATSAGGQATTLAVSINDTGTGVLFGQFAGEAVDANCVLVKYTWDGDMNLDGVVNADDYFLIDIGFLSQAGGYRNGDLNYDGVVNADDYFVMDIAFLEQTGPLAAAVAAESVNQEVVVRKRPEGQEAELEKEDDLLA